MQLIWRGLLLNRFRVTDNRDTSDDRIEPSSLKRRMTPEERDEFVRKISVSYKEYLKSPERAKRLEEITGKTEDFRRIDRLRDALSTVDTIGRKIAEQAPHLMDETEYEDFLSECSKFLKKVESRIKPSKKHEADESNDTTSDSSDKSVVVCKCYPTIWDNVIDSYAELEELIQNEIPDFKTSDGYDENMGDAHDHFRLLKELGTNITAKEVRQLAEKLDIDGDDAIDWIISNNRPIIYHKLEIRLPWSESDTKLERLRNPFDNEEPDVDWPW